MRIFYEEWSPIIESKCFKSSATADEIVTDSLLPVKSPTMADDLDMFLNLSFSHHMIILAGNFKPSYLAQLMTYLRILDDKVKKPHENPSIGIVLCKNANKDFVEYVIQDYAKPMGVATYRLSEDMPEKLREALPDVEELRKLL